MYKKLKDVEIKTRGAVRTEDILLRKKKFVFTDGLQPLSHPDTSELADYYQSVMKVLRPNIIEKNLNYSIILQVYN